MRYLVLLLLAFCIGPIRADECEQLPKPSVTVKRLEERFTVDSHYSIKQLNHLSALVHSGNQVLGLTRGNAVAQFATSISFFLERSGRWECASPQITLTIGFSPVTVYVAKEFPEGSCAYAEIYKHELNHVKTYQDHLASIEKDLADTLNRRFSTGSPWHNPVGQTRTQLQQELNERWLPYVQNEIRRGDEAQTLIDTAEEYARVANSCDGEIRKIIH